MLDDCQNEQSYTKPHEDATHYLCHHIVGKVDAHVDKTDDQDEVIKVGVIQDAIQHYANVDANSDYGAHHLHGPRGCVLIPKNISQLLHDFPPPTPCLPQLGECFGKRINSFAAEDFLLYHMPMLSDALMQMKYEQCEGFFCFLFHGAV